MSSKTAKIKALLLALVFVVATTAFAQTMPLLETDEQRFQYLMHVREQVPGLFEDAAKYDINLFTMLEHQSALTGFLNEHPEYKRALENHGQAYLRAEIHPQSSTVVKGLRIKPEAVSTWREELLRAYGALPKDGRPPLEILDQQILSALSAFTDSGKPRSLGLLTGLIQTLPTADLKAQAFKAPSIAEKIKILKANLPEQLPESFSGAMHGLALRPTQTQALAYLNELMNQEQKLLHLTELHFIAQSHPQHSAAQLEQTIAALTENDLVFFADKDALVNKMKPLNEKIPAFQKKGFAKEFQSQLKGHVEGFSHQTESTSTTLSKGIVLKEMPPGVGIFRGCTGGDCSSQYSFPYPNDPNERLYFIYDEAGGLKGYAQGTIVDVGEKRSFYLITVSGPRMSSGDTKLVIEGLNHSKAALGVEQIVLPEKDNLKALINFPAIEDVFNDYVKDHKTTPIQYKNAEMRKQIEDFESDYNKGNYDNMSHNKNGVVLDSNQRGMDLKVSTTKFKATEFHPQPVKTQDVIEFALELSASERQTDLIRALKVKKISRSEFNEFSTMLKNPLHLSTRDHEAKLKAAFAKYQINESILQRKPALFDVGWLNAADAFAPPYKEKSIETFRSLILALKDPKRPDIASALVSLPASPEVESLFAKEFQLDPERVGHIFLKRMKETKTYNEEAVHFIAKWLNDPHADGIRVGNFIDALGYAKVEDPKIVDWVVQYARPSKEAISSQSRVEGLLRDKALRALCRLQPKSSAAQLILIDEAIRELTVTLPPSFGQRHTEVAYEVAKMFNLSTDVDNWVEVSDVKRVREQVLNKLSSTAPMPCAASTALDHELSHVVLNH